MNCIVGQHAFIMLYINKYAHQVVYKVVYKYTAQCPKTMNPYRIRSYTNVTEGAVIS
jgi:hypothetical protein